MCKERKNIESFNPEDKYFWFTRDDNGNIIENPEGEAKRKEYFDKKKNTSNKPYSEPTVIFTQQQACSLGFNSQRWYLS